MNRQQTQLYPTHNPDPLRPDVPTGHTPSGPGLLVHGNGPGRVLTSPLTQHTGVVGQCDCSQPTEHSSTLVAWLHTTDRCNLRCDYCYLPHLPVDMSLTIGRGIIDTIFSSAIKHGYQQVRLKYAGGEPLLHFALVAELHDYAHYVANHLGLSLQGVLLSNGTMLTNSLVRYMQALGLRLVVSLDGLREGHDCQRRYTSGCGSAADVTRAISLALDGGLVPHISITVSGRNAPRLPTVIAWVLEHALPFSINFYRENEFSRRRRDLLLEEAEIIAGMQAAFRVIEANLPERSLLSSLVDHADLATRHQHTCGVGQNYLVFDPHGRVARCQMQIHRAVQMVETTDPLELVRKSMAGVQNLAVDEKEGCRACEWKYWCAGGCPLTTYRATGRYDVQSPNCTIYRTLYPEVLRLEQLRREKYEECDVLV